MAEFMNRMQELIDEGDKEKVRAGFEEYVKQRDTEYAALKCMTKEMETRLKQAEDEHNLHCAMEKDFARFKADHDNQVDYLSEELTKMQNELRKKDECIYSLSTSIYALVQKGNI